MDDLIIEIQQKTNLSRDKVIEVVTIVTDFMKERLPTDVVESVSEYLSDPGEKTVTVITSATDMASGAARSAKDVATDATGKVVGTATSAFSKATDAVAGVVSPGNDGEE
jgi:hypothetical protein